MHYLAGYAGALIASLCADALWLGTMAKRLYRPTLGDIMLPGVNLPPAIAFYLLYPAGVILFAVVPALRMGSPVAAIVYGALLGLFAYATYDLSNYATLRNWTLGLTLIDIAWGMALSALAATVGYAVAEWVGA